MALVTKREGDLAPGILFCEEARERFLCFITEPFSHQAGATPTIQLSLWKAVDV